MDRIAAEVAANDGAFGAQAETPRDAELDALQREYAEKYGDVVADRLVLYRGLADVSRDIIKLASDDKAPGFVRKILAMKLAKGLAQLLTASSINFANALGKSEDADVEAHLDLVEEHFDRWSKIVGKYEADGVTPRQVQDAEVVSESFRETSPERTVVLPD